MDFQLNTPVVFIIFNRPDVTERVFQVIANAKPRKLLVIADGPRKAEEAERCQATRKVIERVDWDCEVLRNYSDVNLGCKRRVSSGLSWAFEQVPEAIVLEDDCVPDPSFFRFCEELLARYHEDERVMLISGDNFRGHNDCESSYSFTRIPHIWGWASWRRVWNKYDVDMRGWPAFRQQEGLSFLKSRALIRKWIDTFDRTHAGKIDTWDHQLTYAVWSQGGMCIIPSVNLVSNVGFGPEATHTKAAGEFSYRTSSRIHFPLRHPSVVKIDEIGDQRYFGKSANLVRKIFFRFWAGLRKDQLS